MFLYSQAQKPPVFVPQFIPIYQIPSEQKEERKAELSISETESEPSPKIKVKKHKG